VSLAAAPFMAGLGTGMILLHSRAGIGVSRWGTFNGAENSNAARTSRADPDRRSGGIIESAEEC
jgi:hypothetical protein